MSEQYHVLSNGSNLVVNADFFEIVKEIPDKSVPIIFTSPPFKDEDVPAPYYDWYDKFMVEVERICSDYALIFNSSTRLNDIIRRYRIGRGPEKDIESGGPFRVLIWDKGVSQYAYRYEPIFIYRFTPEWNINTCFWTDVLHASPLCIGPGHDKRHPYENPLKLYKQIISRLPEEYLILDPFAGAGTTPVVCKTLGRKWMAFEIDSSRCEYANRRLSAAQIQKSLEAPLS